VSQVHVLANDQALRILVCENGATGSLGLTHDIAGAGVVEEAVVNAAGVPGVDTFRATERGFTDERVPTTVIVACVIMGAKVVLLRLWLVLRCNLGLKLRTLAQ